MTPPVRRGPYEDGPGRYYGWAITSYFGGRTDPISGRPGSHGGQDIAYAGCTGAEIVAPVDGRAVQFWDSGGGGNWTGLYAGDGSYWGFGHASRYQWPNGGTHDVKAGDVIAYVGTTGASTGPHLHIAYKKPGESSYSDPFEPLNALLVSTPSPPQPGDDPDPLKELLDMPNAIAAFGDQMILVPHAGGVAAIGLTEGGRDLLMAGGNIEPVKNPDTGKMDAWRDITKQEQLDVLWPIYGAAVAAGTLARF